MQMLAQGATKTPHHQPKAKSVIFLFMDGGPSQMDTFDPEAAAAYGSWKKAAVHAADHGF
jgi:hypothetical protein